ncbi:HD-GYP domain-containing protein [Alkaliphilus pronyensis]|uniref:HD-GYP domain-containing protein n=1 Tax=Alkaliphilus pronyensis TaxID=1482732 RepID=A0A6I0FCN3_9FIRM|nr:HD-GYP domain-containing protein [Alkaliphilus pronyensis]KAB3535520.1 HD-GYP domain-containing protein [Alkaliphilus pronyensis]
MKKYILTRDAKDGEIVADDVYIDLYNIPVILKNSVINEYIKKKLLDFNISHIYVLRDTKESIENHNEYSETIVEEYTQLVKEMKGVFSNIARGGKLESNDIQSIANKLLNSSENICKIVEALHKFDNIDEYTYRHSINVALYSMFIGKWLGLEKKEIMHVIEASILHDIGKAKIPKEILNKKEALSKEEFDIIKEHATIGYNIIEEYSWLDYKVKQGVLQHHEREDGSGYPYGHKGEKICLYAKIIAVADIYDALTSERAYKPRKTPFDSFEEIINIGYNKLDIAVVRTFLNNIASFYSGTKVRLNNEEVGEIIYLPPNNIISPVIKVKDIYIDLKKHTIYKIAEIL